MDAVPTPMSAPAPQIAVPGIDASAVNPAAYSPTPALDALQTAYQKGLVNASDIMSLSQQGTELQKNRAVSAADIQQANLRKQVQPAVAESAITEAHTQTAQNLADQGLIPDTTAAKSAAAKAATSQAQLAAITANTESKYAGWGLGIASKDPSGVHAALADMWKQSMLGIPFPTDAQGNVDFHGMLDHMYSYFQKPENQTGIDSSAKSGKPIHTGSQSLDALPDDVAGRMIRSRITQYWNNAYYATPEGKAVMDGITKQNKQDLLNNPDGTSKPWWDVVADAQNSPDRWVGDEGAKAMADFNTNLAPVRSQLNDITKWVNSGKGIVGPTLGSGDIVGQKFAQLKAWAGLDPTKAATQEQVDMGIKNQVKIIMGQVHNIRNLYEFNNVIGTIPSLHDRPEVWNSWLKRAQDSTDAMTKLYQNHMPAETKSGTLNLPEAEPIPTNPAGESAPNSPGAPGYVSVPNPADQARLPVGTRYINQFGRPCIKQASPATAPPTTQ